MARERERLTEQIRRAVDASGLSRYGICKMIGLDQATFSRFMAGKGGLALATLDRLADLLRLDIVVSGKPPVIPKGRPGRPGKAK